MKNVAISLFKALLMLGLMELLFYVLDLPVNAWSLIGFFVGAFLVVHRWTHE